MFSFRHHRRSGSTGDCSATTQQQTILYVIILKIWYCYYTDTGNLTIIIIIIKCVVLSYWFFFFFLYVAVVDDGEKVRVGARVRTFWPGDISDSPPPLSPVLHYIMLSCISAARTWSTLCVQEEKREYNFFFF